MKKLLKFMLLVVFTVLAVSCSTPETETSQDTSEKETITNEKDNKDEKSSDDLSEENEVDKENNDLKKKTVEDKISLTEDQLKENVQNDPLKVIDNSYLIQDDEYKSLYPDMLQVIIENNSGEDIRDAVIAFAAWDKNGLPLKIKGKFDFSGGQYILLGNANDINLPSGEVYGQDSGFEVSEEMSAIDQFEAIVVSYETFEEAVWENELFGDFKKLYEGEKRK